MNAKELIAEEIKQKRRQRGYSQQDVADKIGATKQYISAVERGVSTVSFERLKEIADALETQLEIRLKDD